MPIAKARLDRMISMIDSAWAKQKDKDTDPKQFLETPSMRKGPIAEPPNVPQEDSAPQHIHGAGKKDLFK
jgi:hypothetical protein